MAPAWFAAGTVSGLQMWVNHLKCKAGAEPPITPGVNMLLQEGIALLRDQGGILVLEHVEKLKGVSVSPSPPLTVQLFCSTGVRGRCSTVAL